MFIVITGNVVDGLRFHGPFSDFEDAREWTETSITDVDWTIAPLAETEYYH